ncbi:MAG TPA: type II secretion system protein [Tepidisphaeraceae bacterium]|nr:type II secretion system protein [Tepidisphaeraceae bacterium]
MLASNKFRLKSGSAFTLVELLVVIGIIAVLVGILLPALNRARLAASSLACQANLHQIGQGLIIYTGQYKGMLPPGYYDIVPPIPPGTQTVVRWVDLLQGVMSSKYGYNSTDAFNTNSSAAALRKVFVCPEGPNDDMLAGKVFACSYLSHPRLMPQLASPNALSTLPWVNVDPYPGSTGPKHTYNISRVKRSSEIAVIWDAPLIYSPPPPGDPTAGGWMINQGLPVANQIDKQRYFSGSLANSTFLTDNYSKISPPDSFTPNSPIDFKVAFNLADNNQDNGLCYQTARFRHMKNTVLNALMCDGHVESFKYNPQNPQKSTFLRKNINVNLQ